MGGGDKNKYYIVIGSDNAEQIEKWTNYKQLCKENKFIIVTRTLNPNIDYKLFNGSMILINNKCVSTGSATDVRQYISQGRYKNAEKICPKSVIKYIKEKGLYREKTKNDKKYIA